MKYSSSSIINSNEEYSILKLYKASFKYVFPIGLVLLILQFVFDGVGENIAFNILLLSAAIFFRIYSNNKTIVQHQIYFHQVFVFAASVISMVWFVNYPSLRTLVYLLIVGNIATYLMVELKTTISYYLAFNIFLFTVSFYIPLLKLEFVLYSILFSVASILVSKWLNKLLDDSKHLRISEKKYKSLFQAGNNAILLLKKTAGEYKIFDFNPICEDVFEYSSDEFASKGFEDLFLKSNQSKQELKARINLLKKQERFNLECLFLRKNQEQFYADVSFVCIDLNDELYIQVLIDDISEKKRKEEELSATVQSFKNIIDNSLASIFIFSKNKLVYKNANGEALYNECLDNSKNDIFDIFPSKHKYLLSELIGEVSNTVSSYTEISLDNKTGNKKYSISMVNVLYQGKSAILLILIDITLQNEYNVQKIRAEIAEETNKTLSEEIRKHRETQIDLIENTSKLNALFESSSSLFILTIDRDLNISSFNTSFRKMMKYYLGVDVELGNDFLNTFPIEEAAYGKLIKKFKRALRGDSVEIISHFPTDKGEIWVESFISPVRVEGEPIKEIAFIAHNITEKVENERKVLDSEANNKATVSAIPDMLFKINKEGYFTDFRLNEEGSELLKQFAYTTDLLGVHILDAFKSQRQSLSFFNNIKKALRTGAIHTQNFTIPFLIGKTDKKMEYENRYSRVNANEVIIITRDVTDKVEFETRLIESVKEKEILLKEVHHRVKNNLQVISSILNLQSSYVEDEKTLEIINESQNRIRSMSYIHESLYQTKDFSSIDFHDYITNLVQNLVHSYQLYSGKTKLNLNIERVQLALDQAIPCGLILNELVSNSLKHAYPEEEGGEIQIEIKESNGKVTIRVEDFGSGLPEGFKIEESDSLGLGLVDTLIDQIDGQLILKTGIGTKYLIIFEKQDL